MNTKEYLEVLHEIKSVSIATVDSNDLPQVRLVDVTFDNEEGLNKRHQMINFCENYFTKSHLNSNVLKTNLC